MVPDLIVDFRQSWTKSALPVSWHRVPQSLRRAWELAADQFEFYDREMRYAIHPGFVSGSVEVELVGPVIVEPQHTIFSTVEVS